MHPKYKTDPLVLARAYRLLAVGFALLAGVLADPLALVAQGRSSGEICDNKRDDDGDGLVDCADPDCGATIELEREALVCPGSRVTLRPRVKGPHPPFTYTWNEGLGPFPSHTVKVDGPRTYAVAVTDALGCTRRDSIRVGLDTQAPRFESSPEDIVFTCGQAVPGPDALSVKDNTDPSPGIDYHEETCEREHPPAYFVRDGRQRLVTPLPVQPVEGRAPAVLRLSVTPVCARDPSRERRWRLANVNKAPVYATYVSGDGRQEGAFTVPPASEVYFFTAPAQEPSVVVTYVNSAGVRDTAMSRGTELACPGPEYPRRRCVAHRSYSALDQCGNERLHVQRIYAVDEVAPRFALDLVDTLRTTRSSLGALPVPEPVDDCDPAPVVTFADEVREEIEGREAVILRRYTARDADGNVGRAGQVIVVTEDFTAAASDDDPER